MIKIEHLRKEYPNATPLKDVCVEINKGDVITIIGPSGTGKSTLIRCLNQLDPPTSGKVWVDGECITDKNCDISKIRRKMGMVFQSFNLFNHMTIIENIMAAPVDLLKKSSQQAYDDGMELLRTVGLAEKAFNYPDELSGGQKQRVAIARTLAMEPEIVLFDEPTSALDPEMVGEVEAVIRDLAKKGLTMMIVTHDMRFAREVSNRVFYMDEGGVYEDGTPQQIFDDPQKENTKRFIKRIKIFEKLITSRDFDFIKFNNDLDEFARKNLVPKKSLYRLRTVFEELCTQIIIPELEKDFVLSFQAEYSQKVETVTAAIRYSGKEFNPMDSGNFLSVSLAENASESICHSYSEEDEFTNTVTVKVK